MPPEQASGAPVDARADLFAVGALLYELIAATPIYDESDPRLALARARAGDVTSLASVRPETPMSIVELVDRALAVAPSDRFPSARAMAAELERAATQTGGLAEIDELAAWARSSLSTLGTGPETLIAATSSSPRTSRNKRGLPALVALGILMSAGSWWAVRRSSQNGPAAAVAPVIQALPAPSAALLAPLNPSPLPMADAPKAVSSSSAQRFGPQTGRSLRQIRREGIARHRLRTGFRVRLHRRREDRANTHFWPRLGPRNAPDRGFPRRARFENFFPGGDAGG